MRLAAFRPGSTPSVCRSAEQLRESCQRRIRIRQGYPRRPRSTASRRCIIANDQGKKRVRFGSGRPRSRDASEYGLRFKASNRCVYRPSRLGGHWWIESAAVPTTDRCASVATGNAQGSDGHRCVQKAHKSADSKVSRTAIAKDSKNSQACSRPADQRTARSLHAGRTTRRQFHFGCEGGGGDSAGDNEAL